jgi:hypothetical protein
MTMPLFIPSRIEPQFLRRSTCLKAGKITTRHIVVLAPHKDASAHTLLSVSFGADDNSPLMGCNGSCLSCKAPRSRVIRHGATSLPVCFTAGRIISALALPARRLKPLRRNRLRPLAQQHARFSGGSLKCHPRGIERAGIIGSFHRSQDRLPGSDELLSRFIRPLIQQHNRGLAVAADIDCRSATDRDADRLAPPVGTHHTNSNKRTQRVTASAVAWRSRPSIMGDLK